MRRLLPLLALVLAACADGPTVVDGTSTLSTGAPCAAAPAVPGAPPAGAPELPTGSVLTEVAPDVVSGRAPGEVADVAAQVRAAIERAGYVLVREEDEGRGVRLGWFGVRGAGTVSLARSTCPPGTTAFSVRVTQQAS